MSQRVARTPGALYADEPAIARKRRRCDGHLAEPHWIEPGDPIYHCALPPNHSDIGNTGWWHSTFCADCAPLPATPKETR